jgi:hypothetical protein
VLAAADAFSRPLVDSGSVSLLVLLLAAVLLVVLPAGLTARRR